MVLKEILDFGEKYDDVFGAQCIKQQILQRDNQEDRWVKFSTPSEFANAGCSLKVQGILEPNVSDMNFRPYKAIYRARANEYTSEL